MGGEGGERGSSSAFRLSKRGDRKAFVIPFGEKLCKVLSEKGKGEKEGKESGLCPIERLQEGRGRERRWQTFTLL